MDSVIRKKKILFYVGVTALLLSAAVFVGPVFATVSTSTPTNIDEKLEGKTIAEKAQIKSKEIADTPPFSEQRQEYKIEVVKISEIDAGVAVFTRVWDENGQIGFGEDGTVDIERFIIKNPPILVPDENGDIIRKNFDEETNATTTRKYREDPKEALLQALEHIISVKQQKFGDENLISGKVGNTTSTFYPNAGTGTAPIDGSYRHGSTFTTTDFPTFLSTGPGDADNVASTEISPRLDSTATTDEFGINSGQGSYFGFDTSSIGGDAISSATFSINTYAGANIPFGDDSLELVAFAPADESAVVTGDYTSIGDTSFGSLASIDSSSGDSYSDISLNASGLSYINTAGNTFFFITFGWFFDGSFGGTWTSSASMRFKIKMADQTGTTDDPKLVVEHAAYAPTISTRRIRLFEGFTIKLVSGRMVIQ